MSAMIANVSIGIELEFTIATLKRGQPDPDPSDSRQVYDLSDFGGLPYPYPFGEHEDPLDEPQEYVRSNIARKLRQAGINARAVNGARWDPIAGKVASTWEAPEFNCDKWEVDRDTTILPPTGTAASTYDWIGVEIRSPVLWYGPTAFQQLQQVCLVLQNSFRINVNDSCGLHVHIGRGNDGFPQDVVAKIMAVLWTFDPQIVQLHPVRRRSTARWCLGLRTNSQLAELSRRSSLTTGPYVRKTRRSIFDLARLFLCLRSNSQGTELSRPPGGAEFHTEALPSEVNTSAEPAGQEPGKPYVTAGLNVIKTCQNIFDLAQLSLTKRGSTTTAYRLFNLTQYINSRGELVVKPRDGQILKRTIEFRQHEGTIEYARIKAWLDLIVAIVRWATVVESSTVWEVLHRYAAREDAGELIAPVPLLDAFRLHSLSAFYGRLLAEKEHDDEWNEPAKVDYRYARRIDRSY